MPGYLFLHCRADDFPGGFATGLQLDGLVGILHGDKIFRPVLFAVLMTCCDPIVLVVGLDARQ